MMNNEFKLPSDVLMIGNKMLVEFDCKCKPTCDQRDYKLIEKKPKKSYKKIVQNAYGETSLKEVVIEEATPITMVDGYLFNTFLHGVVHNLDVYENVKVKDGYVLKVEYNMLGEEVIVGFKGLIKGEEVHASGREVIVCAWIEEE